MKANEEPKVLYLQHDSSHPAGKRYLNLNKVLDNDIEYTRTDAFIEKMQFFLIDNLKEIPMGGGKMKIKAECSLEELISNLENYMKGE